MRPSSVAPESSAFMPIRRIFVAAAAMLSPLSAQAADLSVGAATDYVWRGLSQTDGGPQAYVSAQAEAGRSGYVGIWASNVDLGDGDHLEYDLYVGVRPQAGPLTLDLGATYYGYAGRSGAARRDYWEGRVGAELPLGPAILGAAVAYAPDVLGALGRGWYAEVNASGTPAGSRFVFSGALGRRTFERGRDYTTWNLGAGLPLTDRVGVDVRYWDADAAPAGFDGAARLVAGIKATF